MEKIVILNTTVPFVAASAKEKNWHQQRSKALIVTGFDWNWWPESLGYASLLYYSDRYCSHHTETFPCHSMAMSRQDNKIAERLQNMIIFNERSHSLTKPIAIVHF